jgi:hypothetical protein
MSTGNHSANDEAEVPENFIPKHHAPVMRGYISTFSLVLYSSYCYLGLFIVAMRTLAIAHALKCPSGLATLVNVFCASLIEEIHFLSYKFPWANTWVL